ncbi:hypothetical protein [Pseudomonas fluorescens]|uniref:hypothetical protein n=1 Tax=Pseudomonas fluorescens TaxID=294 RepID=UPI000699428C|nr:hypothetical protein [Pseudomonas fluorescens]
MSKYPEVHEFDGAEFVRCSDFDRVTAERDALQERLNAADQKDDDQAFQLKDREGSRRDWFAEAQRLQAELDKRPSQIAMSLQTKIKNLQAKLAERDALLRSWMNIPRAASSPELNEVRRKTDYLLSASAEPVCKRCRDSGVIDDKSIDELPNGYFTERGLVACQDCEELSAPKCKTCNDSGSVCIDWEAGAWGNCSECKATEGASHECKACHGEGVIHTGIDELPTTTCKRCEGLGYE